MDSCRNCKWLFTDQSVGYWECKKEDDFTDEEFEIFEDEGELDPCPYFEEEKEMIEP